MQEFERLKHFRQSTKKMSVVDFSLLIGVPQQNYYTYEKGTRGIPTDVYDKLNLAGCDLNWLITGREQQEQKKFIQNHQIGNVGGQHTINAGTDCKSCDIIKNLTEQNKDLTAIIKTLSEKIT